jgi:NADPH:quinone reductase-like Zn-dependent oxidoreductase
MRAVLIDDYGGPERLRLADIPRPEPRRRDVLVAVRATAVNPVDWKIREGGQGRAVPLKFPAVLGLDVSGVVVEVGDRVTRFAPGDEVFSSPTHKRQGTYAEYVAIDEAQVAEKPPRLSHVEAASVPMVGLTAWRCLVEKGRLQAGDKVLIQAGSGGVGSFAIQLAKHLGAVVATTCSARNIERVESLGADRVVDYTREAFEEVLEPQDVVLESLGGEVKERSLQVLRRGGRLLSINADLPRNTRRHGHTLGVLVTGWQLLRFGLKSRLRHGVRTSNVVRRPDGAALAKIAALLESGAIRPIVDRTFSLEEIAEAHRYSQSGRARGKIVLEVG